MEENYIVYIKIDSNNKLIAVNSSAFLQNRDEYIAIDEGVDDKYHHAQGNYFSKQLINENGTHNYIYESGKVREATHAEMDTEISARPIIPPSDGERIDAVESALLALMGGV